jgi:hypothetical protein
MARFIFLVVPTFLVSSHAMWMPIETTPVPVVRVLSNLTRRAEIKTNDFELIHAIARLHSLSYARAASNWVVAIATNTPGRNRFTIPAQTNNLPWFGRGLPLPPKTVVPAPDAASQSLTKQHLIEAITFYERAIHIRPSNEVVHLGLGWCQIQAGQTDPAKHSLNRAIQLAWQRDKTNFFFDSTSMTEEAINYLIPLLHPIKDIQERIKLEDIKAEAQRANFNRRAVTPLAFPLQPNLTPPDLINTNASVSFDLDGSGVPNRKWQWINTNAAWIVHLPQGGSVTSALQMFGNVTFWMFWENGYHALSSLDDNADGVLSGHELNGIQLWHDRDCDGRSTPKEILNLHTLGVTALDTRYKIQNDIPTSLTGAQFSDGSTRATYDLILESR